MSVENFLIGAPRWMWPACGIAAVLFTAVAWNYLRGGLSGWRAVAAVLKMAGIAILAICLVEPLGRGERPRPQANLMPILIDTSRSMTLRNSASSVSLSDRVSEALAGDTRTIEELEQIFDVRRYAFDSRIRGTNDFAELAFDGTASNLRRTLQDLAERYRTRPVAGVLLATDGNWTDPDPSVDWSQLGFPVYAVQDLAADQLRDLRIADVSVSQTDFETAPVTIDVAVERVELPKQTVTVRLVAVDGAVVDEQQPTRGPPERLAPESSLSSSAGAASAGTATQAGEEASGDGTVRFRFRPESSGVSFYRVECFLEGERKEFATGESAIEATLENNRRWVAVHQRRGPYSVLYVGGRPNWEFKFLRRAVDQDAEVRMLGLLRIARKQPKFSFRDSAVGSTNPLFAGLGEDEEEAAEQSDEPVLLRLGVEDEAELVGGFPSDADGLFRFSAVILDDIEADFFTQDQLLLLRRFVSGRGGALLMLGGQEALERGGYADSPLGELAPVYLSRGTAPAALDSPPGPFRIDLTREGLLQPFLRLRSTEAAEATRLRGMPPLSVLNTAERIKPGAIVLAVAREPQGSSHPALVSQSFGDGKTAALLLGDLWRWSMRASSGDLPESPPAEHRDDPAQAWRQMVRWLVNDVPVRVEARVEPSSTPGTMRISVDVRDPTFAPLDGATVALQIDTPDGQQVQVAADPDPEQAGLYTAAFWPRTAGGYRVRATATAPDGSTVGAAETGWAHDAAGDEFEQLGTNLDLLETITRESGGRVVPIDDLDAFAGSLTGDSVPVTEVWVFPLWHRSWVMALAMLCLCGEWGIRRWKGMP